MDKEQNLTPQLYLFLATAIEVMGADKGNVQFYEKERNTLRIVAHIGFNDEFLEIFKSVTPGQCACGLAMETGKRVVVEDTSKDPLFDGVGSTFRRFGFAAVQSTPLYDGSGRFFGMLSTHFSKPHRPSEDKFRQLDDYLSRAAPSIGRKIP